MESERLQRYKENRFALNEAEEVDEDISKRIRALLNDPKVDKYCMVDAYYYDFSVIPSEIQGRLQLWRDAYLIYGINVDGEIIYKWVDRWDLDSENEIVDGKVIKSNKSKELIETPKINIPFDKNLLSYPVNENLLKMFDKK